MSFFRQYFRDLVLVLTEPRRFFEERYPQLSLSQALAFGVLSNWIAAVLMWLTRVVKHESLLDAFLKIRGRLETLPVWKDIPDSIWRQGGESLGPVAPSPTIMELLGIAVSPFQSLFQFWMGGLVLMLGALFLMPGRSTDGQEPASSSQMIRLTAISVAPNLVAAVLGFLPSGIGTLIGGIYTFWILLTGLETRYRISRTRAAGVILFPWLITLFLCGCLVFAFGLVFAGFLSALFG